MQESRKKEMKMKMKRERRMKLRVNGSGVDSCDDINKGARELKQDLKMKGGSVRSCENQKCGFEGSTADSESGFGLARVMVASKGSKHSELYGEEARMSDGSKTNKVCNLKTYF